jgi:hypothetical protein
MLLFSNFKFAFSFVVMSSFFPISSAFASSITSYAYVVQNNGNSIGLCQIDTSDGILNSCKDSGAIIANPFKIAIGKGYTYILSKESNTVSSCKMAADGSLNSCKDSGAIVTNPLKIASGNGYVFTLSKESNIVSSCKIAVDGNLNSCKDSGSAVLSPSAITITQGYAYITSNSNNTLSSCKIAFDGSLNSCQENTIFVALTEITSDEGHVSFLSNGNGADAVLAYCSIASDGSLNSCRFSNGLLGMYPQFNGLALNNGYIYLSDNNGEEESAVGFIQVQPDGSVPGNMTYMRANYLDNPSDIAIGRSVAK